jgi:NADPH-dependent curcumin reductase CurA
VANYSEPVALGAVMRSLAAGRIEASRHPEFKAGELVSGWFGWQDYAAVDAAAVDRKVTERDLPLSTALGVLGLNGVTAYFGLLEVGQPTAGERVTKVGETGGDR